MARRASAMSRVSSLFSAPVRWLVPRASPASSRARLVMLFDPGGATRPRSGPAGGTTVTARLSRSKVMAGISGYVEDPYGARCRIGKTRHPKSPRWMP